jgi:CheY-like chemotaxis protein
MSTVVSLDRPRALTLEENASMRTLLRATLEVGGLDVHEAASVQEALARLADPASRPHVLVLEPVQGRTWTTEVLRWVRQQPALENLPIVVVTRAVGEPHRSNALSAGADLFVSKPFSPVSLAQVVASLARERRQPASQKTPHARTRWPAVVRWGWEVARNPRACSFPRLRQAS